MSAPANLANAAALARMRNVRPGWSSVVPARDALGLAEHTLLHAGPPLRDPQRLPAPLLSSVVMACIHEGWAANEAAAEDLIRSAAITLRPAQSLGAVTPLAAVISPRTALVEVCDLDSDGGRRAWAPLGSGAGPQIRFGTRNPAVLERLAWRDEVLAQHLAASLAAGPIDLAALAAEGLAAGDELHARCTGATEALRTTLLARGTSLPDVAEVDAMLAATPLFFLTLWMAACHLALDTAADGGRDAQATLVVGFAGNGYDCGIRLAGSPERWWTAPASPPSGPLIDPGNLADAAAMIGDSGAIDACGFGAYALPAASAELREVLGAFVPTDWAHASRQHLATADSAALRGVPWTPLDAASVAASGIPARALIAMLDANGRDGLLGRGVVTAPMAPFQLAATTTRNGAALHG